MAAAKAMTRFKRVDRNRRSPAVVDRKKAGNDSSESQPAEREERLMDRNGADEAVRQVMGEEEWADPLIIRLSPHRIFPRSLNTTSPVPPYFLRR